MSEPLSNAVEDRAVRVVGNPIATEKGAEITLEFASLVQEKLRCEFLTEDLVRMHLSTKGAFIDNETPAVQVGGLSFPSVRVTCNHDANQIRVSTSKMTVVFDCLPFAVSAFRADGSCVFASYPNQALALRKAGGFAITRRCNSVQDGIYGLGEKFGGLNRLRQGRNYTLWNLDIYDKLAADPFVLDADHPAYDHKGVLFDPLYVSIPFYYHQAGPAGPCGGFFVDNTYRAHVLFGEPCPRPADPEGPTPPASPAADRPLCRPYGDRFTVHFTGGAYVEYIFGGPQMAAILRQYGALTGRMKAPPLWALGNHQCRWHPYSDGALRQLADQFRQRALPLDALWLDIHYMDGYRICTWDRQAYPSPPATTGALKEQGVRVVTIIDPGVKQEPGYPVYDEGLAGGLFCRDGDHPERLCIGPVWPGDCAFPDFTRPETRRWWADRMRRHAAENGLAGIWVDMNEPCYRLAFGPNGERPPEWGHNQYGTLMARATDEGLQALGPERTFVLSRAGCPGVQRYAANWLGDNRATWDHLRAFIPMAAGLAISGQPFVGSDIGGFGGPSHGELLARWYQAALLAPFFRNHSSHSMPDQYPWSFGAPWDAAAGAAIRCRYRLLPLLYSAAMQSARVGDPVLAPLLYHHPADPALAGSPAERQYALGPDLVLAPVTDPAATTWDVQLPAGAEWAEWSCLAQEHTQVSWVRTVAPFTLAVAPPATEHPYHPGGGLVRLGGMGPLTVPLFVRAGSVVATYPHEEVPLGADSRPAGRELHLFLGRGPAGAAPQATGLPLWEDDGAIRPGMPGARTPALVQFTVSRADGKVRLEGRLAEGPAQALAGLVFTLVLHHPQGTPGVMAAHGGPLGGPATEPLAIEGPDRVRLPEGLTAGGSFAVEVALGPSARISRNPGERWVG
ncbi:putative Alpha-glucosidase 2 [Paratrimastix pyriformis]|uniref:Alpha-glucosidase 2 n=1 Tax=Paratrimastix pyriformis TaxID=342808 RepID=A0ABQ8UNW1_9EUKA|nr:putative Alpha-glucosidase 2 [Paratrimastix pyriformis]